MQPKESQTKKPGRPTTVNDGTKEKIIAATLDTLLEFGYPKTTLTKIVDKANVAKKTIYRFASSKEELIQQALGSWCDTFTTCFEQDALNPNDFFQKLDKGLMTIANEVLSPKAVNIFRLLQSDFPGRDELTLSYQQQGIMRGRAILEKWLTRQHSLGLIEKHNFSILTNLILAMVIAEPLRELALRQELCIPIQQRIDSVLQLLSPALVIEK